LSPDEAERWELRWHQWWAPVDVEKRANAFAAMLLMPDHLVETTVHGLTMTLDSPAAIWEIANRLRTSFSSTLEHLCNRRFIDETIRDQLRVASAMRANQLVGQNSPN
jgi:Zn-dependent peptidase ImmA (M78 family)